MPANGWRSEPSTARCASSIRPTAAAPTVLVGPGPGVTAFAANARGNLLAVAIASGDVTLRSIAQGGAAPRALKTVAGKPIASLVFLPDGRLVGSSPQRRQPSSGTPSVPMTRRGEILGEPADSLAGGSRPTAGSRPALKDGPILLWPGDSMAARRVDRARDRRSPSLRFASQGGRLASGQPRRQPAPVGSRSPGTRTHRADRAYRLGLGGGLRRPRTAARVGRRRSDDVDPGRRRSNRSPRRSASASRRTLTAQEWREYTSGDIPLQTACTRQPVRTGSTR